MPHISSNKVYSQSEMQIWQAWLLAICWNAVTWLAAFKGSKNLLRIFEDDPTFYFLLFFPLVGLFLIASAIHHTLAWYKFGKTPIVLSPFPSQIGGLCSGYLTLPISSSEAKQAILSLSCIHRYTERTNNETNTREEPIWHDKITLKPDRYGKNLRINFAFDLPANLPETQQEKENSHLWRLHIHVPLSGIDFNRTFEVPIEATSEQRLQSYSEVKTNISNNIEQNSPESHSIPQIKKTTSGTQFFYGYAREKFMGIFLMIFGPILALFGYFFFDDFFSFLPITMLFISSIVSLTALAVFLFGLFLMANSLTIKVGLLGVQKQQWIFGFLLEENISAGDIVLITTEQSASSTSGSSTQVWYNIELHTRDGQLIVVGDTLEGQSHADEIKQQMLIALGTTWQAARPDKPEEKVTKQVPAWLPWLRKILPYSLWITFFYDLISQQTEILNFANKFFPH